MNMPKEFLEAGQVVRPHGVRGELSVEPWTDSPGDLAGLERLWFDGGKTDAGLISARVHKGRVLMLLRGVDSPEKAEALRGRVLYCRREDLPLPPGEAFLQDLVGLRAVDGETGAEYGVLTEVLPTPANDVYRIVNGAGEEFLFPAVKHMIKRIAPGEGVIELLPIPGIFDGGEEEA